MQLGLNDRIHTFGEGWGFHRGMSYAFLRYAFGILIRMLGLLHSRRVELTYHKGLHDQFCKECHVFDVNAIHGHLRTRSMSQRHFERARPTGIVDCLRWSCTLANSRHR